MSVLAAQPEVLARPWYGLPCTLREDIDLASTAQWNQLKHELRASARRDFERQVLTPLKIRWPELVNPTELAYLDRAGIDHTYVQEGSTPSDPLAVVVQCKGFQTTELLDASQVKQLTNSVNSFLGSKHSCRTYLLVYNREAIDRGFHAQAKSEVDRIVQAGRATEALVWDLNKLIEELSTHLKQRILHEIRNRTREHHKSHSRQFTFGDIVLDQVPYSSGRLQLREQSSPRLDMNEVVAAGDPLHALRWGNNTMTLVVGRFGSGKSTLAARILDMRDIDLISVPASKLNHTDLGGGSENALASQILAYLEVLGEDSHLSVEERCYLLKLGGPLLAQSWRVQDGSNRLVLLIDAIDEHRVYGSSKGFQILVNELARAWCPVIVTTRQEHFKQSFLDTEILVSRTSPWAKGGVAVVQLDHWGLDQAISYLDQAGGLADAVGQERLRAFSQRLLAEPGLASLMQTPLFLAMATDLVIEDESVLGQRVRLYEAWIEQKLLRDFRVARYRPAGFDDDRHLIRALLKLMQAAAAAMVQEHDGQVLLSEWIGEEEMLRLAETVFGARVSAHLFAVTSLMEPLTHATRIGKELRYDFFHQSFKEYFLAKYHCERGTRDPRLPIEVLDFMAEIESCQSG